MCNRKVIEFSSFEFTKKDCGCSNELRCPRPHVPQQITSNCVLHCQLAVTSICVCFHWLFFFFHIFIGFSTFLGIACIALSFVDAAGRPVQVQTQKTESNLTLLDTDHFDELTTVVKVDSVTDCSGKTVTLFRKQSIIILNSMLNMLSLTKQWQLLQGSFGSSSEILWQHVRFMESG